MAGTRTAAGITMGIVHIVIVAVGVLVLLTGVLGMVQPERMRRWTALWTTPARLYLALGLRALLGIVFVLGQYDASSPAVIGTLGWVMIVAALTGVALGTRRLAALVSWFAGLPANAVRLWALLAAALGVAILVSA